MLLSFAEGHDAILAELELATRHEGMTSDGVQSCMWRRDGNFSEFHGWLGGQCVNGTLNVRWQMLEVRAKGTLMTG